MKRSIVLSGRTYDSGGSLQDRYGLSPMTVYRWTKDGFLPQPINSAHELLSPQRGRKWFEQRHVIS